MRKTQLDNILAKAKRDVLAGKQPGEVSAELCKTHGLNWMLVAPKVAAFKREAWR